MQCIEPGYAQLKNPDSYREDATIGSRSEFFLNDRQGSFRLPAYIQLSNSSVLEMRSSQNIFSFLLFPLMKK
jgi:hypothetical protein